MLTVQLNFVSEVFLIDLLLLSLPSLVYLLSRASCKGRLTVSKQRSRLAGLKPSFRESFFHVETSQFL